MKKKAPPKPNHTYPKPGSLGRKKVALVVGLVLSLSLTGIILAQFKGGKLMAGNNAMLVAPVSPTPPSLSPTSPSKEYIYAGGKLIATEEPSASATPTPTPSSAPTPPTGGRTEEVVWTNYIGAAPSGNSLTKTATTAGWGNAGAISTRGLASGDGFVEFTATEANTSRMCGLSDGDASQSHTDIKYAIYPHSSGQIYIYESGAQRSVGGNPIFGSYAAGDKFRVAVEGGVVKYRRNGALLYTSAVTPSYPLLVDTSLYTVNSTITDAYIAGNLASVLPDGTLPKDVTWTNTFGVDPVGNDLTKTGGTGWNAGAISTQSLASGDGFVEFTTDEANKAKMCGLNVGDVNQTYGDLNYAIYPAANGNVYIYESGTAITQNGSTVFGTYVAGDTFRVAVEGAYVKYYKNGTLLYQSGVTPTYPMVVDTSLYTTGATIKNVVVAGFTP